MTRGLILIAILASPSTAFAQLDEKSISDAIALGRANAHKNLMWTCQAKQMRGGFAALGVGGAIAQGIANKGDVKYVIAMMAARGRLAVASWQATQAGERLERADVQPDWLQPRLFVLTSPELPVPALPDVISDAVFRENPGQKVLLKPTGATRYDARQWKGKDGAVVEYQDSWTTFDATGVNDVYSPTEVQFTVSMPSGERSCGYVPMRTIRNLIKTR